MPFFALWGAAALAVLAAVTLLWMVSILLRDASIVDIFWGLGFLLASIVYFAYAPGYGDRKTLVLTLVAVWSLRLSIHLFVRNAGKGEDFRYQKFRENAGDAFWWRSYFTVFLAQGFIIVLISAPLLAAQYTTEPAHLTPFDFAGIALWLVGMFFETVGDWQLTRFKANPDNKGKLLTTGLWRYTRHPNYFGDACVWFGYFLIALADPSNIWTIYAPVLMTFILLRVSGVKLLERSLKKSKPGYEDYMQRTSAFVPLPPKKRAAS